MAEIDLETKTLATELAGLYNLKAETAIAASYILTAHSHEDLLRLVLTRIKGIENTAADLLERDSNLASPARRNALVLLAFEELTGIQPDVENLVADNGTALLGVAFKSCNQSDKALIFDTQDATFGFSDPYTWAIDATDRFYTSALEISREASNVISLHAGNDYAPGM